MPFRALVTLGQLGKLRREPIGSGGLNALSGFGDFGTPDVRIIGSDWRGKVLMPFRALVTLGRLHHTHRFGYEPVGRS